MPTCGLCGAENPSDAVFCGGCGARLAEAVSAVSADVVAATTGSVAIELEPVESLEAVPAPAPDAEGPAGIFCAACGARLAPDAVFCAECGHSLTAPVPHGVTIPIAQNPALGAALRGALAAAVSILVTAAIVWLLQRYGWNEHLHAYLVEPWDLALVLPLVSVLTGLGVASYRGQLATRHAQYASVAVPLVYGLLMYLSFAGTIGEWSRFVGPVLWTMPGSGAALTWFLLALSLAVGVGLWWLLRLKDRLLGIWLIFPGAVFLAVSGGTIFRLVLVLSGKIVQIETGE